MRVGEAREAADLAAVPELTPGEELHHIEPRAIDAHAPELMELTDLGDRRIIGGLEQLPPLLLECPDARRIRDDGFPFPLEARAEERRHWRAIPESGRGEMRRQLPDLHQGHSLTGQEPFDPIGVAAAVAPGEEQLAVDLAAVLFGR